MRLYLTIALLFTTGSIAIAHIGEEIFLIPNLLERETQAIDLNDGSLDDWPESIEAGFLSLGPQFFLPNSPNSNTSELDSTDLNYAIYIAWSKDENRIYVGFQKDDDIYIEPSFDYDLQSMRPNDSSIEFMIDGDHSGGEYGFPIDCCGDETNWLATHNKQAQHYLASATPIDGQHLGYVGAGVGWVNAPPYAYDGGFVQEFNGRTRSVVEFYVTPFDNIVWNSPHISQTTNLEREHIIGFQISVPDFDDSSDEPESFHTLLGAPTTWRNADRFVDGFLLDIWDFQADCFDLSGCGNSRSETDSTTVIMGQTWGRIKASLK